MNSSILKTRDVTMINISVIHTFSKEIFISNLPTRIKGKTVLHAANKLCFTTILLFKMWPEVSNFLVGITLKYSDQPVYNIFIEVFLKDGTAWDITNWRGFYHFYF